jgi:hypothetical protein
MANHLAPATAATLHQEAYVAGRSHATTDDISPATYSDDWSLQHEYENGFHGRPYWY